MADRGGGMATRESDLRGVLQESELFETLEDEHLDRLVEITRERNLSEGEVVFTRGETAKALYAVTGGQFKALATSADGREIVLRLLDPGVVFGEIALLDGGDRTATVVAAKPSTLATLDRRDLLKLMRASPDIALNLLAVLAARLRATTEQMEESKFLLLPARLARRLLTLADTYGVPADDGSVKIKISQEELGSLIGTSRVSVNQQLQAWQRDDVVKTGRGAVHVLNRSVLEDAAKEEG
jgi:CRP-like cAMP-binding protein